MENASKALIIAGAILLSILLISLGIMVYQNAKGTIDDANLDEQTIQAFNDKFSNYCGSNKSAATVQSLIQAIMSNNTVNTDNGRTVSLTVGGTEMAVDEAAKKTPSRANKYTIEVAEYSTSGLISKINITPSPF